MTRPSHRDDVRVLSVTDSCLLPEHEPGAGSPPKVVERVPQAVHAGTEEERKHHADHDHGRLDDRQNHDFGDAREDVHGVEHGGGVLGIHRDLAQEECEADGHGEEEQRQEDHVGEDPRLLGVRVRLDSPEQVTHHVHEHEQRNHEHFKYRLHLLSILHIFQWPAGG